MSVEIRNALHLAAGHERTAYRVEKEAQDKFTDKMKSAGYSAFEAFSLAARDAHPGRKIDDAALLRLYKSTTPRPWWDAHLRELKLHDGRTADREWGNRIIQWHTDPDAAQARRVRHTLREATQRKAVKAKSAYGARAPQAEPASAELRTLHKAAQTAALAGRDSPKPLGDPRKAVKLAITKILTNLSRISDEEAEILRDELDRLVREYV